MSKQQVIELIGKDTVLEFHCMIDSVMEYRTVQPVLVNGEYINYKIGLFFEDGEVIFKHDTISGFLDRFQIFELTEVRDLPKAYTNIYKETYKTK